MARHYGCMNNIYKVAFRVGSRLKEKKDGLCSKCQGYFGLDTGYDSVCETLNPKDNIQPPVECPRTLSSVNTAPATIAIRIPSGRISMHSIDLAAIGELPEDYFAPDQRSFGAIGTAQDKDKVAARIQDYPSDKGEFVTLEEENRGDLDKDTDGDDDDDYDDDDDDDDGDGELSPTRTTTLTICAAIVPRQPERPLASPPLRHKPKAYFQRAVPSSRSPTGFERHVRRVQQPRTGPAAEHHEHHDVVRSAYAAVPVPPPQRLEAVFAGCARHGRRGAARCEGCRDGVFRERGGPRWSDNGRRAGRKEEEEEEGPPRCRSAPPMLVRVHAPPGRFLCTPQSCFCEDGGRGEGEKGDKCLTCCEREKEEEVLGAGFL